MGIITVKAWRKVRPESTKGKGVAEAVTAMDKALAKAPSAMTEAEVKTAKAALSTLNDKMGTVKSLIDADKTFKKDKDKKAAQDLVEAWKVEIRKLTKTIEEGAGYTIKVAAVQEAYNTQFDRIRQEVDQAHAAARLHNQNNTQPTDSEIQVYLTAVRDGAKICSKASIKTLMLGEAKLVKETDIVQPPAVKVTKAKIVFLQTWSEAFAKQAKTNAKGATANLDDTVAVEKAIKDVMAKYKLIETGMKAIIVTSKQQAAIAKQLAERIKDEIGQGNTDSTTFSTIARGCKATQTALNKADTDMKALGDEWRMSTSPIGRMVSAVRKVAGYVEGVHGKMMTDRMQANQMMIRQVSLPLGEGNRQLERAKRLLSDSTNHRGYAAAF